MRQSFATGQFILLYLIIILIYEFFDCHDICTKPDLGGYKKLVFENGSYENYHHYNYSQTIRFSQPVPVVKGSFKEWRNKKEIAARFPFTFYGSEVKKFEISTTGRIELYDQASLGVIESFVASNFYEYTEVLDQITEAIITTLIHPNGKISIYYGQIPDWIGEHRKASTISGLIRCTNEGVKRTQIDVPKKWIHSGTLVEYEPFADCPKQNSSEACRDATTSYTTCVWCENINTCITNSEKHIHQSKVNGCQDKNSIVEASIERKTETDLRNESKKTGQSAESHLNMTTDTTEDFGERKSSQYPIVSDLDFLYDHIVKFMESGETRNIISVEIAEQSIYFERLLKSSFSGLVKIWKLLLNIHWSYCYVSDLACNHPSN
ncbi:unnamed protein product [Schistosoma margrebowiei]|uniref:Uncharacterized protein n=1 Tax=Schistosoma margrebowiei TaxID=48269 RepID=A0AA85AHK2_9TREM|nr:unnamed protein product [Schistosoma margrebowiei]